ncbi:hypothetical protein HYFRA_00008304 [Hymenoscyphus fraxineus]|uniref:Uncharacterized protein n=1 Tax=Hymenoscyphus fraxineus TaxID=746836 RepID=A0A9N9KN87_9HELO|nr:hypothetical protein HYFRA_00008304 [Hymenoscyphus fraxineus]
MRHLIGPKLSSLPDRVLTAVPTLYLLTTIAIFLFIDDHSAMPTAAVAIGDILLTSTTAVVCAAAIAANGCFGLLLAFAAFHCLFMVAEHTNIVWDHSRYEEDHPYDSQPEAYDEEDDVGDTGGWGQITVETRVEEVVFMDDGDDSNMWGRAEVQEEEIDGGDEGNQDTKKENEPTRDHDGDVEMTEADDNDREEESVVAIINFDEEDLYDA